MSWGIVRQLWWEVSWGICQAAIKGGMEGGKRSRGGGRLEARVMVPSRMAGSVIGKGGANIQKLRSEYSAGVRIPDCPGPERIMSVQVSRI